MGIIFSHWIRHIFASRCKQIGQFVNNFLASLMSRSFTITETRSKSKSSALANHTKKLMRGVTVQGVQVHGAKKDAVWCIRE